MKRLLTRFLFVAAILCFLPCSITSSGVQRMAVSTSQPSSQISSSDVFEALISDVPQMPVGTVLRSPTNSHRVASSRSVRLLTTHGSKPGQQLGRWAANNLSNLSFPSLLRCHDHHCHGIAVASPRLYYVIALRRLLC